MSLFLLQVREMLERHLDAVEIAGRLHATLDQVHQAIDTLTQLS